MIPPSGPPPPPPPNLPKPGAPGQQSKDIDRSALLSQIHQGTKLKRTITNDRSSPLIAGNKPIGVGKDRPANSRNELSDSSEYQSNEPAGHLSGLFAQGMPKLKPTNRAFLDGGNYKSQLTPRLGLTGRTSSNLHKLSQNPDFKPRISVSQPATPQFQRQKPYRYGDGTVASHDRLNLVKSSLSKTKISPVSLKNSSDSLSGASLKEMPTSSTSVHDVTPLPNFSQDVIHHTFLHQTDSLKWGGSDPNLTSASIVKPRTSSKPLPPPKSNASVTKPLLSGRSRSFEEDKLEDNLVKTGKSGFSSVPPSLPKNPSEPSKLHVLQNQDNLSSVMLSTPLPQNISTEIRNVKKPPGAPPLPLRPPMTASPSPKNIRQASSGTRNSPVTHPSSAPPPPPPRIIPQVNTSKSKCLPQLPTSETRSLPPVPPTQGTVQSVIPPESERKITSDASLHHASSTKPLFNALDPQPVRPARKQLHQSLESCSSEISSFETRYGQKFRDVSELPKPDEFEAKRKIYPSSVAKQRAPKVERSRIAPPVAPPPPPPPPLN